MSHIIVNTRCYYCLTACVKEGNDICLPIQKCSGVLPTFLVNGEVYFPRSVNDINNGKICLRRVNNHIHFLEVCHKKSLFCSSYKDEFVISKRGQIEVTTGEKACTRVTIIQYREHLQTEFNNITVTLSSDPIPPHTPLNSCL